MRTAIVLCALALLVWCACDGNHGEATTPKGHVIAKVDKQVLTLEQIRSAYGEAAWDKLTSQEKREQVQNWVNLTLLAQEADHLGMNTNPGIAFRMDCADKKIKANSMMSQKLPTVEPTEDEMFAYYTSHKNEFTSQTLQLKIQRIFVHSKAKADQVMNELRSGMDFKQAASIYSEEANGKAGGFMGFQTAADYDATSWEQIAKLDQYTYGEITDSRGYYIVRWYEQQNSEATTNEFLSVKPQIREKLIQQKKEDTMKNLLDKLKTQSNVEISI